jgi:hypothetical protein
VICAGCAAGEQFGDDPDRGGSLTSAECHENGDCWDGDPATEDICAPDGKCAFLTNVKSDPEKDPEEVGPGCQAVGVIDGYTEIDVSIEQLVAEAVHTVPVEYGVLYQVSLDAPARLEVVPDNPDLEGVMFVLLSACANACKNRIAWGSEICSPVLEAGDYLLAVFSERARSFAFTADLLLPEESCDGLDVGLGI